MNGLNELLIKKKILFNSMRGLCCCEQAFSSCGDGGSSPAAAMGLLSGCGDGTFSLAAAMGAPL